MIQQAQPFFEHVLPMIYSFIILLMSYVNFIDYRFGIAYLLLSLHLKL